MDRETKDATLGATPPPVPLETRWAKAVMAAAAPPDNQPATTQAPVPPPQAPAQATAPAPAPAGADPQTPRPPVGDRMSPIMDTIRSLLAELEREARATVGRAEMEVSQVREGANREAAAIIDQSRKDADNIRAAARTEADRVIAQSDVLTRDYLSRLSGLVSGLRGAETGGAPSETSGASATAGAMGGEQQGA